MAAISATITTSTGEEHEAIEITKYLSQNNHKWVQNLLKDASKMSVTNQTLIGGLSGWCFGLLFAKVGKIAAVTVGTSLLLLQVAHHQGYVNVNWKKLGENAHQIQKAVMKETGETFPCKLVSSSQSFFEDNMLLASVFAGGFLLGLSWFIQYFIPFIFIPTTVNPRHFHSVIFFCCWI